MKTKFILTAMFVGAFGISMMAQNKNTEPQKKQQQTQVQGQFVDNNGDRICDNFTGTGKGNSNGQGKALHQGNGNRNGKGKGSRNGKGQGQNRQGKFIDNNQNGICDNKE